MWSRRAHTALSSPKRSEALPRCLETTGSEMRDVRLELESHAYAHRPVEAISRLSGGDGFERSAPGAARHDHESVTRVPRSGPLCANVALRVQNDGLFSSSEAAGSASESESACRTAERTNSRWHRLRGFREELMTGAYRPSTLLTACDTAWPRTGLERVSRPTKQAPQASCSEGRHEAGQPSRSHERAGYCGLRARQHVSRWSLAGGCAVGTTMHLVHSRGCVDRCGRAGERIAATSTTSSSRAGARDVELD